MPRPARLFAALAALWAAAASACLAEESPLVRLQTGDDNRGWEAVGRLNLGDRGFCTGALIAPDMVLTAAHCLFDKESGARIDAGQISFLAGWRNGRAEAYRGVKRAVPHPEYVYGGHDRLDRVAFDLALLQLDQAIRLPSVTPFETEAEPADGDPVGVVSYAQDRADVPSIQEVCHVLGREADVLVLSCNVDFGSSGAPVFAIRGGLARVVSVISAKAELNGQKVALGTVLDAPLGVLLDELAASDLTPGAANVRVLSGQVPGGAKFLSVDPATGP
jgi:V8-like Glu-specific endopeptidase